MVMLALFKIAPPLENTLDALASSFEKMRRSVIDGSYSAQEQRFYGPSSVCETFDIEPKLEVPALTGTALALFRL